jgi:glycerophosphoryl diester phosphodiesterase
MLLASAAARPAPDQGAGPELSRGADPKPLIIGHRGASGHRPEHTLESYRLASEMGADFIEPDLVSTKDGVLVARHENEIGGTTDVAVKFPDRKATKTIDGQPLTGWFSEDFTLVELKTLRAKERLAFRSHEFDGRFEIPTFEEVIALAQKLGRDRGRTLGIYPETKHPSYFRGIGLPLEPKLLATLEKHGWNRKDAPVFIQSFESDNLKDLRQLTKVRLIQLTDVRSPDRLTDAGLKAIAQYADGIGPDKASVIPVNADRTVGPPTDLVQRAHAAGLLVHIYTIRIDKEFLSPSYDGHPELEYQRFAALGVDGMFTDFPDAAVKALRPAK